MMCINTSGHLVICVFKISLCKLMVIHSKIFIDFSSNSYRDVLYSENDNSRNTSWQGRELESYQIRLTLGFHKNSVD